MSKMLLHMFSSRIFMVWGLTFKSFFSFLKIYFLAVQLQLFAFSLTPPPWFCPCVFFFKCIYLFLIYLLIMLLQLSHFPSFTPLNPAYPLPLTFPTYRSCPQVIHISSLTSTFPILFLPSPCLFSNYRLFYLFSVPFPLLSPSHSPVDNPPCDLHFHGSIPVLVVCLVCFCFCFRCGC